MPKKFSHCWRVLSPTSGFPAWGFGKRTRDPQGIWLWRPGGSGYGTEGKRDSTLGWHKQNLYPSGPRRKEQWPQETELDLLARVEGLLWRCGLAVGHHWGVGPGSSNPGRCLLLWALLETAINPTTKPVDSKAGLPQVKQLTGRKHSSTHEQTIGLKFYWALPCPQSKTQFFPRPVPPIKKLTQASYLASSRDQTEVRTTPES